MKILGYGKLHMSLLLNSSEYPYIDEIYNTVYVPSKPFNIIPPQCLLLTSIPNTIQTCNIQSMIALNI